MIINYKTKKVHCSVKNAHTERFFVSIVVIFLIQSNSWIKVAICDIDNNIYYNHKYT